MKNKYKAINYCGKEDKTPLTFGMDYAQYKDAKLNKKRILGKRLMDPEEKLTEIVRD